MDHDPRLGERWTMFDNTTERVRTQGVDPQRGTGRSKSFVELDESGCVVRSPSIPIVVGTSLLHEVPIGRSYGYGSKPNVSGFSPQNNWQRTVFPENMAHDGLFSWRNDVRWFIVLSSDV